MPVTRRNLLEGLCVAAGGVGLAGCSGLEAPVTDSGASGGVAEGASGDGAAAGPAAAVAAEWNATRARLSDAAALASAGRPDVAARVAADVDRRFQAARGDWSARRQLAETNQGNYDAFESALGDLVDALRDGDVEAARDAAGDADAKLLAAIRGRTGLDTAAALSLQLLGARVANAGALAATGSTDASAAVAERALAVFEDAAVHDALEAADEEAYQAFEASTSAVVTASGDGDASMATTQARNALQAAVDGAYALTGATVAGAGHLAVQQARGFDAAAVASLGGPGIAYAHASALTTYRAWVADATLLASQGALDRVATLAAEAFAAFEVDPVHDVLEDADRDAYEGFEEGLRALREAGDAGDHEAVADAVETVDDSLLAGVTSLVGGPYPALLESAFYRARLGDATERYRLGDAAGAAAVAEALFARFEADAAGFHEALEDLDPDLYEAFEHDHLAALPAAMRDGDDDAVTSHLAGAVDALDAFATRVAGVAAVSGAEAAYLSARAFDSAALSGLGHGTRASTVAADAYARFEADAGGFHEALEGADRERYERFETDLEAVDERSGTAAADAARAFRLSALDAAGAVVADAGGDGEEAAAALAQDVFGSFETARVHDQLEDADRDAYEAYEHALTDLVDALTGEADADAAADAFARAARRAQFAVAGAGAEAPASEDAETAEPAEPELTGGPDVVDGVPGDADHVVEMQAVTYAPAELTVAVGDTVAFAHADGEPHTVTAYGDGIPADATYWASGGFDSQGTAEAGWDDGAGAVRAGESYVHTFETPGRHEYYCVPHEAAGMTGVVVVEE